MKQDTLFLSSFFLYFKDREYITVKDIYEFYVSKSPSLTTTTLHWRIHCLVQKELIHSAGRGKYTMVSPLQWTLDANRVFLKIHQLIHSRFSELEVCMWNSKSLSKFIDGNIQDLTIIEVPKKHCWDVYIHLSNSLKYCFLNPNKNDMKRYVSAFKSPILIFPLITGAPTMQWKHIQIPKTEKIVVDLLAKPWLVGIYKDVQFSDFFSKMKLVHTFNMNMMTRYAGRRNKAKKLQQIVE